MTRKEIEHMAREAGFYVTDTCPLEPEWFHFANLVSAAEREACADLCEQWDASHPHALAAAIRARGRQ